MAGRNAGHFCRFYGAIAPENEVGNCEKDILSK